MTKNFAANLNIGAKLSSSVGRVFGGLKNKIKEQEGTLKKLRAEYKLASKGTGEYAGQLDKLQKEITQTEAKLKSLRAASKFSLGGSMGGIGSSFMSDSRRLAAGAGILIGAVTAVGTAIYATTKGFVDWADNIGDSAEALGMSTQALQTWQFAAATVGVGGEKMTASIAKFNKTIQEGSDKTLESLAKLHINGKRLKKLSLDQQLEVIAEAFKDYKGTDKAAIAMELFGRSGYKIAGILSKGKEGLDAFKKAGMETGAILDDDASKAASDAATALDMFGITMIGLRNTIAIEFVPTLTKMVETIRLFVRTHGDEIKQWARDFGQMMQDKVVPAMIKLLDRLPGIVANLSAFAVKAYNVADAVQKFLGGWDNLGYALVAINFAPTIVAIGQMVHGLWAMAAASWGAIGPWGLLVAGIVAMSAAIYDLSQENSKLYNWLTTNFPDAMRTTENWIFKTLEAITNGLARTGSEYHLWLDEMATKASMVITKIIMVFEDLKVKAKAAADVLKFAFEEALNFIASKFDAITAKITALWEKAKQLGADIGSFFGISEGSTSAAPPIVKPEAMPSSSTSQTQNNSFNINVNAPGGDGRRIADQLRQEFNRKPLFDMDGALVPG